MSRVLPPLPEETNLKSDPIRIQFLLDIMADAEELIINDRYQRGEVGQYKPQFRTRLIESIIRGFPLPALLVMKKSFGPDELIDGQQRVRTIKAFMDGDFRIEGKHLMMLPQDSYDGIKWSDLDASHKKRIRQFTLYQNVIDDSMPDWMVYVLINAGQNPLNKAELRKALMSEYEGYWTVDQFARQESWTRHLTNAYIKREKATETAFKALVSMYYGESLVAGNQNTWLEHHMKQMLSEDLEFIETRLKQLNKVMRVGRQIFGDYPFGMTNVTSSKVKNPIIMMMTFALHQGLLKFNQKTLESNASLIRDLMSEYFEETVSGASCYSVSGIDVSERNNELWSRLDKALSGVAKPSKRSSIDRITPEMRHKVIETYRKDDQTVDCQICGETFMDESQISVDHKEAWIAGGETILENLQPTHGACNSSKHSRSEVRVFAAEEE